MRLVGGSSSTWLAGQATERMTSPARSEEGILVSRRDARDIGLMSGKYNPMRIRGAFVAVVVAPDGHDSRENDRGDTKRSVFSSK